MFKKTSLILLLSLSLFGNALEEGYEEYEISNTDSQLLNHFFRNYSPEFQELAIESYKRYRTKLDRENELIHKGSEKIIDSVADKLVQLTEDKKYTFKSKLNEPIIDENGEEINESKFIMEFDVNYYIDFEEKIILDETKATEEDKLVLFKIKYNKMLNYHLLEWPKKDKKYHFPIVVQLPENKQEEMYISNFENLVNKRIEDILKGAAINPFNYDTRENGMELGPLRLQR